MRRYHMPYLAKRIAIGVIIVAFGGLVAWLVLGAVTSDTETSSTIDMTTSTSDSATEQRVSVAAMGDMLAHDTIIENAKRDGAYNFAQYFKNVRPLYKDADVVYCNQEGLSSGSAYGITGYPAFNAPTEFAAGLQSGAGCNFINLANNHVGDKGAEATNATINKWNDLKPLVISGANQSAEDQTRVRKATVNGITISLVSFTDFNNNTATPAYSVNTYRDQALVRSLVTDARKSSDVVIASMHWGTEDSIEVNDDQKSQVQLLASLGVDVVIGTGPHVLQKHETVTRPDGNSMQVWYSLGNFLSAQLVSQQLFSGVAKFDVVKQQDGTILVEKPRFAPTYMHYDWTATEAAASNYLARKNAMLYPLQDSSEYILRSQLQTTMEAERAYIAQTLGNGVTIED